MNTHLIKYTFCFPQFSKSAPLYIDYRTNVNSRTDSLIDDVPARVRIVSRTHIPLTHNHPHTHKYTANIGIKKFMANFGFIRSTPRTFSQCVCVCLCVLCMGVFVCVCVSIWNNTAVLSSVTNLLLSTQTHTHAPPPPTHTHLDVYKAHTLRTLTH